MLARLTVAFVLVFDVFLLAAAAPAATVARARRGMVAAEHPLAAEAGATVLAAGGNAVDAAVAAAFATGVVNPSSSGIGGGGFLVARDASGRSRFLDFRETAPRRASRDMFVTDGKVDARMSLRGGLAVATPGEVAGLARAAALLGRLPLERVIAPAIRYAAEGFPVGAHLAEMLRDNAAEIRADPGLAAIYLKPGGEPWTEGETLTNPDLAATLRTIAAGGADVFYRGELAGRIAAAVASRGGVLTTEDLAGYAVKERPPVAGEYRGLAVVSAPPPSSGGGVLLEALNILSGFDLRGLGPKSATALHLIAEAEKLAFADRARDYGDPDFVAVPMAKLLSAAHATELRRRISPTRASADGDAGTPPKGGTSHISALDAEGGAAALTTTINTAFGALVIVPGAGILLNNEMDDFAAAPGVPNAYGLVGDEANSIRPGKRPLSSMTPTIVVKDGRPMLAIGGSGGPRIVTSTLQTLIGVADFALPLADAVAAARVHHQWKPDILFVEPGLYPGLVAALRTLGHTVREMPAAAAVAAVAADGEGFVGVGDARKGGAAAGW